MKPIFTALSAVALGATLTTPLLAQNTPTTQPLPTTVENRLTSPPAPLPQDVVEGETYFMQRVGLPPDANVFVSLMGRVAGVELPLASTIVPAFGGPTPFRLLVTHALAPAGPYRLQAWVVAGNRLLMSGTTPQTTLNSLDGKARIGLAWVFTPKNGDGIGDSQPLTNLNTTNMNVEDPQEKTGSVRGTITKRDRRALSPDAQIEVTVSDISLADAPSKVVGRQTFSSDGKQVPISFTVPINPDDIQANRRYTISVRVTEGGKLTYISDTNVPVTPKNLATEFEVNVVPVGGG